MFFFLPLSILTVFSLLLIPSLPVAWLVTIKVSDYFDMHGWRYEKNPIVWKGAHTLHYTSGCFDFICFFVSDLVIMGFNK